MTVRVHGLHGCQVRCTHSFDAMRVVGKQAMARIVRQRLALVWPGIRRRAAGGERCAQVSIVYGVRRRVRNKTSNYASRLLRQISGVAWMISSGPLRWRWP